VKAIDAVHPDQEARRGEAVYREQGAMTEKRRSDDHRAPVAAPAPWNREATRRRGARARVSPTPLKCDVLR
jgi:hypothetical protein